MRILSFDQASINTGWSLFENGNYVDSGVIHRDEKEKIETRIVNMGLAICAKIKEIRPDIAIIEDVQSQSNAKTVIQLARLQGGIMLYCASKKIRLEILHPTTWRAELEYKQGSKVKREELKAQSAEYVKKHLGFDNFSEDQNEACCIGLAANKLYTTK